jgi:hypothetical protein
MPDKEKAVDHGPKWKGPRNLPKPSPRKKKRLQVRKSRRINRGAYSGQ